MKHSIAFFPLFGQVAVLCGAITVNRSRANSRRKALSDITQILQKGDSVLFFPEGTRSKDTSPKPFEKIKKTLLRIAFDLKIPVIPISIYGTRNILSFPVSERTFSMIGHQPIHPSHFDSQEAFAKACWDEVLRGFTQLQNEFSSY